MPGSIMVPILLLLFFNTGLFSLQPVDTAVKEIIDVFKMHFDIGYMDFADSDTRKYSNSMMKGALSIIEKSKPC